MKAAQDQLATIAGQQPSVRRARKSIAAFKLREGMPVGLSVTLRPERSYEFLDRLISIAIPRIRDFRGLHPRPFDGRGNYSMGVPRTDHLPRDRLRRDRPGARAGHHDHHQRAHRRRGLCAAVRVGDALLHLRATSGVREALGENAEPTAPPLETPARKSRAHRGDHRLGEAAVKSQRPTVAAAEAPEPLSQRRRSTQAASRSREPDAEVRLPSRARAPEGESRRYEQEDAHEDGDSQTPTRRHD